MSRVDTEDPPPLHLDRGEGIRIAYHRVTGAPPTVVFLGGYASDMTGTKARYLDAWCRARGQAYLRFDYQGHGASSGRFEDGTIGTWRDDALAAIHTLTAGPLVLVGSSMGGWIMLLAALAVPERVRALVGMAAAPDFTEDLAWARFSPAERDRLEREGVLRRPSEYRDEPLPFTWKLIEDGRRHVVLRAPIPLTCPVRLLHGLEDTDVPWKTSLRLARALASRDVVLTLLKGGGHRLSEPHELGLLGATLAGLSTTREPGLLANDEPERPPDLSRVP
jgi:pimeloyl-ACP methyl ester carboxylesterase